MVGIGNDHAGVELKREIIAYFEENNIAYTDFGCHAGEKCDYPDAAKTVCDRVVDGTCDCAVLICGTGVGISMAANKVKGIRAACCSDYFSAKYTRVHNNANVLCLGARVVGAGLAVELVDVFLHTEFETGGRHSARVAKIDALDERNNQLRNEICTEKCNEYK
ncbi:MAG: ribose 5-phosphate isomerase B [Oscillospiraceae bacterium]